LYTENDSVRPTISQLQPSTSYDIIARRVIYVVRCGALNATSRAM